MKKYSLLLLALFALPAHAGNWQVDEEASAVRFEGVEQGAPFKGEFRGFTADISFEPDKLAEAKVMAEINVADAVTGSAERDGELNGPDWFDTDTFPTAKFASTAFRHLDGNRYEADGTLTIRDVTKPLTLPFTLDITGDAAAMTGEVTLARTDYGLGRGEWQSEEWVAWPVKVIVNIKATRGTGEAAEPASTTE